MYRNKCRTEKYRIEEEMIRKKNDKVREQEGRVEEKRKEEKKGKRSEEKRRVNRRKDKLCRNNTPVSTAKRLFIRACTWMWCVKGRLIDVGRLKSYLTRHFFFDFDS